MGITAAQQAFGSLVSTDSRPKWVEKAVMVTLPRVTTWILLLFTAFYLAQMTWRFIEVPESGASASIASAQTARPGTVKPQKTEYGAEIANLHLFGIVGQRVVQQRVEKAPETRLNLTLHGVFVGKKADEGSAIIGKKGGKQQFYQSGAKVSGGVSLKEVHADHVVLERNGRQEILRFPKSATQGVSMAAGKAAARAGTGSLKTYKDTFTKQPFKIFEHLRFVPVRAGKGIKGYRILPQRNRELFNKLGVKTSDLVTAINSTPLTDERKSLQLLNTLKTSDQIILDIVRDGNPQSIVLNLN